MPIFELDAGRPVLVQPMQPAAGTFSGDTASVVANHLSSLLGEQLFPVSTRKQRGDGPHLLAVDAAGQPVVVEVVSMLDADAVVRSLRFAGAAARLTSADLARAYHVGPERFATDLVAFRENVPVAAVHAAARHAGARLLLVCSEVAENAVDAVEFLRQTGRQVQVLQVGVVQGADGRRYVDVSPLASQVPARRAVEPSALEFVHESEADVDGAGHEGPGAGPSAGAVAPIGTFPSVLPIPVGRIPAPRVASAVPAAATPSTAAASSTAATPAVVGQAAPAPDPMLAELGRELAVATTLVWTRRRRGLRLVATLRVDGLIQLPGGELFAEPDAAAAAAADSEYTIDGWRVWRLGDDGPTLDDVRNS